MFTSVGEGSCVGQGLCGNSTGVISKGIKFHVLEYLVSVMDVCCSK